MCTQPDLSVQQQTLFFFWMFAAPCVLRDSGREAECARNLISVSNTSKLFFFCVFAAPHVLYDGGKDAEYDHNLIFVQRRQALLFLCLQHPMYYMTVVGMLNMHTT